MRVKHTSSLARPLFGFVQLERGESAGILLCLTQYEVNLPFHCIMLWITKLYASSSPFTAGLGAEKTHRASKQKVHRDTLGKVLQAARIQLIDVLNCFIAWRAPQELCTSSSVSGGLEQRLNGVITIYLESIIVLQTPLQRKVSLPVKDDSSRL